MTGEVAEYADSRRVAQRLAKNRQLAICDLFPGGHAFFSLAVAAIVTHDRFAVRQSTNIVCLTNAICQARFSGRKRPVARQGTLRGPGGPLPPLLFVGESVGDYRLSWSGDRSGCPACRETVLRPRRLWIAVKSPGLQTIAQSGPGRLNAHRIPIDLIRPLTAGQPINRNVSFRHQRNYQPATQRN